jgi:CheY-like chemotaxis protein
MRPRPDRTDMITVLIVDDQPLQRLGFRMLLESNTDTQVVGEAGNGADAVRQSAELRPDVVLMDVRMPGMDGTEATRRIVEAGGRSRILMRPSRHLRVRPGPDPPAHSELNHPAVRVDERENCTRAPERRRPCRRRSTTRKPSRDSHHDCLIHEARRPTVALTDGSIAVSLLNGRRTGGARRRRTSGKRDHRCGASRV